MRDVSELIGRVFLAAVFLFEAYVGLIYFEQTKEAMLDYGISWQRDFWAYAIIFLLILSSTLLILGYKVRLGAFLLLLYWIPATFITFKFWKVSGDPELMRTNIVGFIRSQAISGGLLLLIANGAGRYSVKRLVATFRIPKE